MPDEQTDLENAEELRQWLAKDLGSEISVVTFNSLIALVEFDTVNSATPKLLIHDDEMIIALYPNVVNMRGLYTARMKEKDLKIFRKDVNHPLAHYSNDEVKRSYDLILKMFGWNDKK
jgi:hypothetical protein